MQCNSMNAILNHLDMNEIMALVNDMVGIPSHPGVKGQETALAGYISDYFRRLGIDVELVHVIDGRKNVVARIKGSGKARTLMLTGHLDTVPPYEMKDPYRVKMKDGKMYGLGVVDMKSSLACMMAAMSAIKKSGYAMKGDLVFAGVIDEENASLGTSALVKNGIKCDGAIVGEPSGLDICIAHRGLEWFEIVFRGKTVHGGKQEDGINAIEKSKRFMDYVEKEIVPKLKARHHRIAGSSSMNYGYINGGTQPSTVPGECILRFDRRWIPGESFQNVLTEYSDILNKLHDEDPTFNAELRIMQESRMRYGFVHESMEIDPGHELVRIVSDCALETEGKRPSMTAFTGWTDAGILSAYGGIPSVVFGPGSIESAHSPGEYINVSELLSAARIYTAAALKFCNEGREVLDC